MTLLFHILLVVISNHGPKHLTSKSAKHFSVSACVMQLGMTLKRIVSKSIIHVPSLPKTWNRHFQKPTKANIQNCASAVLERDVLLTCDSAEQYTS